MAHGRRKRGHHEGGHENAERWLLTYSDLITLLMVFFVVLYSMSSASATKFQAISAALQQAFNLEVLSGQNNNTLLDGAADVAKPADDLINNNDVPEVQKLQSSINAALAGEASGQTPDVTVGTDKDGVVIRLSGSYLFDSGRAELKPNSMGVLDAIANELKLRPNEIRVDGHTDSIPLTNSSLYATNWELSAARAVAVARYFSQTDGVQASRLIAAGFGEYHPIVPNDTREHRAQNRRVEIHVLSSTVEDPTQVIRSPAGTTLTPTPTTTPTGATEYLEP